ncbi:MAG: YeiH family protein [Treponema sp.]|nr:YeiH family protein [Treponema sp.]
MKKLPGILLCLAIAAPAWFLGKQVPLIGGPVAAIVAGILISLFFPGLIKLKFGRDFGFTDGLKFTSKKLLQYSIVLLGFDMNLFNILRAGQMSLTVMAFTFTAVFFAAFLAGRAFKLSGNTTVLIGVGTSICGGSAIAAVAPVIRAEDEDVTRAISTIFLFNLAAVFIFPPLGRLLGMDDINFGIWAGTAVNDTSSVVAAATSWSNAAGSNTALNFATIVKLTRTLMIVPVTLVLAIYTARKSKNADKGNFSFVKVFPWFVLFFMAAAIINTFLNLPPQVSSFLFQTGKFVIIMAMAAIGLNTSLKSLFAHGVKPLLLGMVCWLTVGVVALIVLKFSPGLF